MQIKSFKKKEEIGGFRHAQKASPFSKLAWTLLVYCEESSYFTFSIVVNRIFSVHSVNCAATDRAHFIVHWKTQFAGHSLTQLTVSSWRQFAVLLRTQLPISSRTQVTGHSRTRLPVPSQTQVQIHWPTQLPVHYNKQFIKHITILKTYHAGTRIRYSLVGCERHKKKDGQE